MSSTNSMRRRGLGIAGIVAAAALSMTALGSPAFASAQQHLVIAGTSVQNLTDIVPIQGGSELAVRVRVRNEGREPSDFAVTNDGGYDLAVSDVSCSNGVSPDTPSCEYDAVTAPRGRTTTTTFTVDVLGLPVANSPHGTLHDRVCVEDLSTGRIAVCRTIAIHGVESD